MMIFKKYVGSVLKKMHDQEGINEYEDKSSEIDAIRNQIELGLFMPKITSTSNGVIPYQLHLHELQSILKKRTSSS